MFLFPSIDFQDHRGNHPTLGIVDNIVVCPLGDDTTLDIAATYARSLGQQLYNVERIPVYFYGNASSSNQRLQNIRRKLGYFRQSLNSSIAPAERLREDLIQASSEDPPICPDLGDVLNYSPYKGISAIGAIPLIENFNIRFTSDSLRSQLIQITRALRSHDVSQHRNHLPSFTVLSTSSYFTQVEALTLPHDEGQYEIACNLLNPIEGTTKEMVLTKVNQIIDETRLSSVTVNYSYSTNPTKYDLLQRLAEMSRQEAEEEEGQDV
jgi:hypothetical protein